MHKATKGVKDSAATLIYSVRPYGPNFLLGLRLVCRTCTT